MTKLVTIFGASSRQGQAQVGAALAAGYRVRAVTRSAGIFAGLDDQALEIVAADFSDPGSLDRACHHADILFFQRPQLAAPAALDRGVANVAAAAKRAGISFAVYNSTMWAPDEPCGEPGYDHVLALEELFLASGLPTVIFRPVLFMDNIATLLAKPALVREGVYRYSHRPGLLATWISLEDVAKFMVAAIDRHDLIGERLTIGGPETLAIEEVVAVLAEAMGKPIRHEFVPPRRFGEQLAELFALPPGSGRDAYLEFFDSFYSFNNYAPQKPFEFYGMATVLEQLPVDMKTLRRWAFEQDWTVASLDRQCRDHIGSPTG